MAWVEDEYGSWTVTDINKDKGTVTIETKKPPERPGWVPEEAVRMRYYNPSPTKRDKEELVWIELNHGERPMMVNMPFSAGGGWKEEPALYATNKGWLLKKYLRPIETENEWGPVGA